MKKIPTLFVRDEIHRQFVTAELNAGCEWVIKGEGKPTRKYDGTCVMYDGKAWWARREVKPGALAPVDYIPLETDVVTGKTVGWMPIAQSSFAHIHLAAETNPIGVIPPYRDGIPKLDIGTYELIGVAPS